MFPGTADARPVSGTGLNVSAVFSPDIDHSGNMLKPTTMPPTRHAVSMTGMAAKTLVLQEVYRVRAKCRSDIVYQID